MSCVLAEILPSSDNTIEVLTNVTPDTATAFTLRNSGVAVLSVPDSFDADGKPFKIIISGKKHATSTSTTCSIRLVLGSSSDLGSDTTLVIFASMDASLNSAFSFVANCFWDSVTEKLVLEYTSIVGIGVTRSDANISSVASQANLQFALFGQISSTGFDSSDSISITEFKLETI